MRIRARASNYVLRLWYGALFMPLLWSWPVTAISQPSDATVTPDKEVSSHCRGLSNTAYHIPCKYTCTRWALVLGHYITYAVYCKIREQKRPSYFGVRLFVHVWKIKINSKASSTCISDYFCFSCRSYSVYMYAVVNSCYFEWQYPAKMFQIIII